MRDIRALRVRVFLLACPQCYSVAGGLELLHPAKRDPPARPARDTLTLRYEIGECIKKENENVE